MSKIAASKLAVVILAAGKGSRMKSTTPKVLHKLAGRELILHVLDAVAPLQPHKTIVITGHAAEDVEACINTHHPAAQCIRQQEQNGTGHAVQQAEDALRGFEGTVVILNGDVPLIQTAPLEAFIHNHVQDRNAISVASTVAPDPTGLGRILREDDGTFTGIREHKDATDEEREIDEVNVGFYAAENTHLFNLLGQVTNNNAQGEYYLPDIVPLALQANLPCEAHYFEQPAEDLTGINNRGQLAMAEIALQDKLREMHMANGVTLQDPATVYFAWDTEIAPDVTIEPNVVFGENVQVAEGVTISTFSRIQDTIVKSDIPSFSNIKAS